MRLQLKGSSWAHTRGHDPLVAACAEYERSTGIAVEWVARTLTEFGVLDVGTLAREFDLVVIDHPHIGGIAAEHSLIALDEVLGADVVDALGEGSPGRSHQSYALDGRQWAVAIDAACQVSVHRHDADGSAPRSWSDVERLAREGAVLWPLNPVDSQASFLTFAAQLGSPIDGTTTDFVPVDVGLEVFERMHSIARHLDRACFDMNAIDVLESLSAPESEAWYCPLVFGYTNYARRGYRPSLLRFGDIPLGNDGEPSGALLGGVVGRDNEAEMMPIPFAALGEILCILVVRLSPEQLSLLPVPGHAVAAQIGEMRAERRAAFAVTDHARLDHRSARARGDQAVGLDGRALAAAEA